MGMLEFLRLNEGPLSGQAYTHPGIGRVRSHQGLSSSPTVKLLWLSKSVKAYWAEMDATTVAARDSAIGQRAVEHYFEEVLEGARLIETQCSKKYYA